MSDPTRGVIYVVWGERCEAALARSIKSLRKFHPELPVHIDRPAEPEQQGLWRKTQIGELTPFASTLYLDADTIVMGRLDHGFAQAERFGLACCICECPWLRRYGPREADATEYNTGVLFFTASAGKVFSTWQARSRSVPSTSRWTALDGAMRGLPYEDQASFAYAIRETAFNPSVLPLNFNLRPAFHHGFFAPIKIWHDFRDPPPGLAELSLQCEENRRPVTYVDLRMYQKSWPQRGRGM